MNDQPESPETSRRWNTFVELLIPAATELRKSLRLDDESFRSRRFTAAPRDFFFWTVLDEVVKAGMFLIKLDGHLGEEETTTTHGNTWVERTSSSLIIEEERLRTRRLCEVLYQLVLFAQKDDAACYRHFLLLEEICAASRYNEDLSTFHAAPSAWIQLGVDQLTTDLLAVEPSVDFAQAWYANYQPPFNLSKCRNAISTGIRCADPVLEAAFG